MPIFLIPLPPSSLHLRPVNICCAATLPLVTGEGDVAHQRAALCGLSSAPSNGATPPDPDNKIEDGAQVCSWSELCKLVNDHTMQDKKALQLFTCKNFMTLPNRQKWKAADDKQLDSHFDAGAIAVAVPCPASSPKKPSQVFCLAWARLV